MSQKLLSFAAGAALDEARDITEENLRRCAEAHEKIRSGGFARSSGYGWYALPDDSLEDIRRSVSSFGSVKTVIQAGIGGSALGSLMLEQALRYPENLFSAPEVFVADNVDPRELAMLRRKIDPATSLLVVISKSGGTAETMANFLWLFGFFQEKLGRAEALKRVMVLTDPEKGLLRDFVKETSCASLPVPSDVGGRFSVLSSVGLFGACLQGLPVEDLLRGARDMRTLLEERNTLETNPAWLWSVISLRHAGEGRNMSVLMPYGDGLESFAEWFAQLWGESLGKKGRGTTPVRALGAIDQHSQVQLYAEGPDDKLYTLMALESHRDEQKIPFPEIASLEPLRYLQGHSFGEMLRAEARATASALVQARRPVCWMEIPRLDSYRLGGLIFFFEYATALTGLLMGINPFDQPGVEQGKRNTYGLMGREGYGAFLREVEERAEKMYRFNISL